MNWNPWKVAAIAMALFMGTALVTGLVVANWVGIETKPPVTTRPASPPARRQAQMPAFPTQAVVDACNEYAAAQAGDRDKTADTVKNAAVGAVVGAAVGAAGGAIADGGKGAGKGGQGVEETAKGIGKTIVEGAKFTGATIKESGEKAGEKAKEASEAAEPKAKSAWAQVRDGAVTFGQSVKSFFRHLFGG